MLLIATIVVWAMLLGMNPGLVLIAAALGVFALDRYDPSILDRIIARR